MAGRRKYEVFISSTFEDLKGVRKRIIEETLKSGNIPSAMEFFRTGEQLKDRDLIEDYVKKADIFVIIVGHRYGTLVGALGKSFTVFEYECAEKYNKPMLKFLLDEDKSNAKRESFKNKDPERKLDYEYADFRSTIENSGIFVEKYSSTPKLITNYINALQRTVEQLEGKNGWVRGELYDQLTGQVSLNPDIGNNHFIVKIANRLNDFKKLSDRCSKESPYLKQAIARRFIDEYLAKLIQKGINKFFFESGSSLAFVSEAFIDCLNENRQQGKRWATLPSDFKIHTNNILTYMDFALSERVNIELYPYGPPEPTYGATFGPLIELEPPSHPKNPGEMYEKFELNLKKEADEKASKITEWFENTYENNGIILMAASGVDLNKNGFYGPHVSSFYNMLFKRAILKAKRPTIMFLDQNKLPMNYNPDKCYPVCDKELTWKNICTTNPFGIAVAMDQSEKEEIKDILIELGLKPKEGIDNDIHGQEVSTVIATNAIFDKEIWN